ncbi:hypothetical protein [Absidia glauca]|uniref:Uncharacterized protein n=1 Tax=Absidia glauca TaxID=4829 RepID=A0A163KB58_ABSGL|nr:hypothetical protein [Absidia glauca]
MAKRQRTADDSDLANVLRQRQKHDPIQAHQKGQETFALMMRAAARHQTPSSSSSPSQQQDHPDCFRCPVVKPSCGSCTYCENPVCQQCIQQCHGCVALYCTACSVIE